MIYSSYAVFVQESQITVECTIPRKHHRNVLGTKGIHVQEITQQHNVSVKFPDREDTEQIQVADGETDPRDTIVITGRKENCDAARQALLVRGQLNTCVYVYILTITY